MNFEELFHEALRAEERSALIEHRRERAVPPGAAEATEELIAEAKSRGGALARVAASIADIDKKSGKSSGEHQLQLATLKAALIASIHLAVELRRQLDEVQRVTNVNLRGFNSIAESFTDLQINLAGTIDARLARHGFLSEEDAS